MANKLRYSASSDFSQFSAFDSAHNWIALLHLVSLWDSCSEILKLKFGWRKLRLISSAFLDSLKRDQKGKQPHSLRDYALKWIAIFLFLGFHIEFAWNTVSSPSQTWKWVKIHNQTNKQTDSYCALKANSSKTLANYTMGVASDLSTLIS